MKVDCSTFSFSPQTIHSDATQIQGLSDSVNWIIFVGCKWTFACYIRNGKLTSFNGISCSYPEIIHNLRDFVDPQSPWRRPFCCGCQPLVRTRDWSLAVGLKFYKQELNWKMKYKAWIRKMSDLQWFELFSGWQWKVPQVLHFKTISCASKSHWLIVSRIRLLPQWFVFEENL